MLRKYGPLRSKKALTERQIQAALTNWCDAKKIPLVHVPNEGQRSVMSGYQLKRMGLRRGFPDLFIPVATIKHHGLFIELKRNRSSHKSPEQKWWILDLNARGYHAVFAYGLEDAIRTIEGYLSDN